MMKRLRTVMGLVAICGMSAFLAGCDDDDDNNGGNNSNAPSTLRGKSYTLTDVNGASTITFSGDADTYQWIRAQIESGNFVATRDSANGDIYNVALTDSEGQGATLRLTFGANNTGNYTYQRAGQAEISSGSFAFSSSSGTTTTTGTDTGTTTTTGSNTGTTTTTGTNTGTTTTTGTDTGTTTTTGTNTGTTTTTGTDTGTTTTTGTNTGTTTTTGTDTGTTTTTGTNTGTTTTTGTDTGTTTTTGTNTGTTTTTGTDTGTTTTTGTTTGGSVQAPAQISTLDVQTTVSALDPTTYTITLTGGSSGTFNITGNSVGTGTFTYTPSGTTAQLVLTYTGDYLGDEDRMTLVFSTGVGGTRGNNFSGTQDVSENKNHALAGTFAYQIP